MRHLASVIGAVIGVGLYAPQAMAADNGDFSLKPGEAKQIVIGAPARELRICNNSASGGPIGITLGDHTPLVLQPGMCADDMGDRILATNQGSAPAMGTWRTNYAPSDHHQGMPTVRGGGSQSFGENSVDFFNFDPASVNGGFAHGGFAHDSPNRGGGERSNR